MQTQINKLKERMDISEKQGKIGRRWQYAIFGLGVVSLIINIWEKIWMP